MKGGVLNATWGRTHARDLSQNFVSEGAKDVNKAISIVFNLCVVKQWLPDVVTNIDSRITFELRYLDIVTPLPSGLPSLRTKSWQCFRDFKTATRASCVS